jgi:zinc ribbon protein
MYCPHCGSNNLDEIKFCTRCGTNLNIVSEALSGKSATGPQFDERMVKALKDYYASRRAMVIGGGLLIPVGAAVLLAMAVLNFPETLAVVSLIALGIGLTIYGAMVGFWGIRHWIDSTSEMKALNVSVPAHAIPAAPREKLDTSRTTLTPALVERYSTDPIDPGSVTESTTRQLEGPAPKSSPELQSD